MRPVGYQPGSSSAFANWGQMEKSRFMNPTSHREDKREVDPGHEWKEEGLTSIHKFLLFVLSWVQLL